MMRALLFLLLIAVAGDVAGAVPAVRNYGGTTYPLAVSVPSPMASPRLVVFLHGLGEKGDGSSDGTATYSATNQIAYTWSHGPLQCIVNGVTWFSDHNTVVAGLQIPTSASFFNTTTVDNTITSLVSEFGVDTSKICVTGLSLGGGGVWNYGQAHPSRCYSLVPIAGSSTPVSTVTGMSGIKMWAFHDSNDGVVPVAWDTGTLFASQPYTTAWLYQMTGISCIDNHPDSPTWFTHAVAPQLSGVVSTNTANWNGSAWTWSAGTPLPTGNPAITLYNGGGHGGWDLTYGTNTTDFNTTFWTWALGVTATNVTSGLLMPLDH